MIKQAGVCFCAFSFAACPPAEERLFDVALQVRVADAIEDNVSFEPNSLASLNLQIVDDAGAANGADPRESGAQVEFSAGAKQFRAELLALDGAALIGLGRTALADVPAEGALDVNVLLAPAGVVGAVDGVLPLPLGLEPCITADEQGRVFTVGGDADAPSYVFNDRFAVDALADNTYRGVQRVGCSASAGFVYAVGGCVGGQRTVVIADGDDATSFALPAAFDDECGVFAAGAPDDEVWLVNGERAALVTRAGVERTSINLNAGDVKDVEPDGEGLLVLVEEAGLRNVLRLSGSIDVQSLGNGQVLGRNGRRAFFLNGTNLVSGDNELVGGDVGVEGADVSSFAVLSALDEADVDGFDLRVAAVVDGALRITGLDPIDVGTRTHVSVLRGNTLMLAGGADRGLDALAPVVR